MGHLAQQNSNRAWKIHRSNYRCKAITKAGAQCKLHGPHHRCHKHRLETVDEQLKRERNQKDVCSWCGELHDGGPERCER